MAPMPFYVMVGAGVLAGVLGLILAYTCGLRSGQRVSNVSVVAGVSGHSSSGINSTPSKSAAGYPSKAASPGTMFTMDAFAIKEAKKQQLLEKARKRYLELHPDFVPPIKSKTQ